MTGHHITLDPESTRLVEGRAASFGGNISKAIRSFIKESVDPAFRLRICQRAHLRSVGKTMAVLRLNVGPSLVPLVQEMQDTLDRMEQELVKVTTS